MKNKSVRLGMLVIAVVFTCVLTSCWSAGRARETLGQSSVTIQRVRTSATLLGEIFGTSALGEALGTERISLDSPMKVYIDHNEPIELANGESTTIILNNGEHIVHAVLGDVESNSVKFNTNSRSVAINITTNKNVLGRINLQLQVR